jgi:hypothetical protein
MFFYRGILPTEMKAILEFSLPEDEQDHKCALSGTDALLAIEDILDEIRTKLKYESGFFLEWKNDEGKTCTGDIDTLERVRQYICEVKRERNLPELE